MSHFPDVESKRNTTTVQQKSLRVRERERFKRLIFKQLEKGMRLERGLLLSFAVVLSHTGAHKRTHTHRFLEFQALVVMLKEGRGKLRCPAQCGRWANVSCLQAAQSSEVSYCGNEGGIPGPFCSKRRSSGAGCSLLPKG